MSFRIHIPHFALFVFIFKRLYVVDEESVRKEWFHHIMLTVWGHTILFSRTVGQ